MLISNIFINRLDDLINSSDKENIISCCQIRNATSFWLATIKTNSSTGLIEIDKNTLVRNRNADHSKIK